MKYLIIFLLITGTSFAHPGGLDEKGGHVCRTNCEKYGLKMGEYHFHKIPEAASEPDMETDNPPEIKPEIKFNDNETKTPHKASEFTSAEKTEIEPAEPKTPDKSSLNIFIAVIIFFLCTVFSFIIFLFFKVRKFACYLKNKFFKEKDCKYIEKS